METIPADVPYLFADPALVETWQRCLADYAGFKVGIGWQGNPKYVGDRLRSIPLRHFTPLARVPGVRLFSLQKGAGWDQIATVADDCPVIDFGADFDAKNGTFMDTAAVMRNLDLVIASDTAVAHLAGALGVPVWVALGYSCDWRWLDEREDSPWYPTMRLFRQARLGDWDELFARIAAELVAIVAGQHGALPPAPKRRPIPIRVRLAPGELLDKISILEIKRQRISDPAKLAGICRELDELRRAKESAIASSGELEGLYADLSGVNQRLWAIEDSIRACEARGDFGHCFVELARSVYRSNDQRTAIKRRINDALGSELSEEKLYPSYE